MITWMQRHRKYLVITIWISTFAFIGAGFVGWGQYNYGDKAGAVAKVGDLSISQREWQQAYSRLYGQYNKVFQGNFDEKQAESFGLKQQAMRQVVEQALILNLAKSYNLEVTKEELSKVITAQDTFFDHGVFSKKLYLKILKQNHLNVVDYENDLRNSILIQKTLSLFQSKPLELEKKIFTTVKSIADKIEYKILDSSDITLDTSDEVLHTFWKSHQQNYMNAPSFSVEMIRQEKLSTHPDEKSIQEYYSAHRSDFLDADGKILELKIAQSAVVDAIDAKATNKQALRGYIAFKKGKLDPSVTVEQLTLSKDKNPLSDEILSEVAALNMTSPFLKPRQLNDGYVTIKLVAVHPATPKTFEEAKPTVLSEYINEQSAVKLQELANSTLNDFNGTKSDYITSSKEITLEGMSQEESKLFISKLFAATQKKGFIPLSNEKLVLFNIEDQKLIEDTTDNSETEVTRLKGSIFNASLIKMLESKYKVVSFVGSN